MAEDPTMSQISLNGSVRWAAARIGWPLIRFKQKREILETNGFPTVDRITNLYVKADIDAWINRRRQVADNIIAIGSAETTTEVNLDAI
jgi:hypothetical protein